MCLFETSCWGWDQWFLLLPFWNVSSGILPLPFLKSANSWDRRVWKTDCVKSLRSTRCLSMSFHMRAHCTVCFLKLYLERLWEPGPSNTPKKALWNKGQRAGAAKLGFSQVLRNKIVPTEICISQGKISLQNECPSWNKRIDTGSISSSSGCSWSFLPLSLVD